MSYVKSVGSCCTPACTTPTVVNTPGPQGPSGADGVNGLNGESGFTTIIADEGVQPAVNATVDITVGSTAWMIPSAASPAGMRLVIGDVTGASYMGYYRLVGISNPNTCTIENLGYTGAAAPGTPFVTGMRVTPAGIKGQDGSGVGVFDVVSLSTGVATQAIAAPGGDFGFVPSLVLATVLKPSGGMTIFPSVHSLALTGFSVDLSGVIPASGYSIQYIAYP